MRRCRRRCRRRRLERATTCALGREELRHLEQRRRQDHRRREQERKTRRVFVIEIAEQAGDHRDARARDARQQRQPTAPAPTNTLWRVAQTFDRLIRARPPACCAAAQRFAQRTSRAPLTARKIAAGAGEAKSRRTGASKMHAEDADRYRADDEQPADALVAIVAQPAAHDARDEGARRCAPTRRDRTRSARAPCRDAGRRRRPETTELERSMLCHCSSAGTRIVWPRLETGKSSLTPCSSARTSACANVTAQPLRPPRRLPRPTTRTIHAHDLHAERVRARNRFARDRSAGGLVSAAFARTSPSATEVERRVAGALRRSRASTTVAARVELHVQLLATPLVPPRARPWESPAAGGSPRPRLDRRAAAHGVRQRRSRPAAGVRGRVADGAAAGRRWIRGAREPFRCRLGVAARGRRRRCGIARRAAGGRGIAIVIALRRSRGRCHVASEPTARCCRQQQREDEGGVSSDARAGVERLRRGARTRRAAARCALHGTRCGVA